jgi:HEAT repeat protein
MDFVSKFVHWLGPAGFVIRALVISLVGIILLLAFILIRRFFRERYFRRRDERTLELRRRWDEILVGTVPAEQWRFDPLSREIVESILLDSLEVASGDEMEVLRHCLRVSGLLDMRIYEARKLRGWRRRRALVSLGRMRVPEGIPALAEGLDSRHADARLAAARGLGRCGLPEAAEPILDRVTQNQLRLPLAVLQNALLHCCRTRPSLLYNYMRHCDDEMRPILARVLAEVATAELGEDLVLLAADPLPEVRASAARALAGAKPRLALTALQQLAADDEWFVRLRAVVALGMLNDARAIPVLLETLCDPNRLVRLRSAAALARLEGHQEEILQLAIRTGDRYALQALISEMQRAGAMLELLEALAAPAKRESSERMLLAALHAGAQRMLLDALVHHSSWRVRLRVARLLASSGETALVPQLELLETAERLPRQRRILRWVLGRLRETQAAGPATGLAPVTSPAS